MNEPCNGIVSCGQDVHTVRNVCGWVFGVNTYDVQVRTELSESTFGNEDFHIGHGPYSLLTNTLFSPLLVMIEKVNAIENPPLTYIYEIAHAARDITVSLVERLPDELHLLSVVQ